MPILSCWLLWGDGFARLYLQEDFDVQQLAACFFMVLRGLFCLLIFLRCNRAGFVLVISGCVLPMRFLANSM